MGFLSPVDAKGSRFLACMVEGRFPQSIRHKRFQVPCIVEEGFLSSVDTKGSRCIQYPQMFVAITILCACILFMCCC